MSGHVAIVAYASNDYVFDTQTFKGQGQTTIISNDVSLSEPKAGGAAHFAREIARTGDKCSVVSWVGTDNLGDKYCCTLSSYGVDISGIDKSGSVSPSSHIFYPNGQKPIVFFNPGNGCNTLSPSQKTIIRQSDVVCLAIAPREAAVQTLESLSDDARLIWSVKADPKTYDVLMCRDLVSRSSVISLNRDELCYLRERIDFDPQKISTNGVLVIITQGSRGVKFYSNGQMFFMPADELSVTDATGAGDTFVGRLCSEIASSPDLTNNAEEAGRIISAAMSAAGNYLIEKMKEH